MHVLILMEKIHNSPNDYITCYICRLFFCDFMNINHPNLLKGQYGPLDCKLLEDAESVMIPMSMHFHWYLLVPNPKSQCFEHYSSISSPVYKQDARKVIKPLSKLFGEKLQYDGVSKYPLIEMECLQQDGGDDCGVYLIEMIELLSFDMPLDINPSNVPLLHAKQETSIIMYGELYVQSKQHK